MAVNTKEIKSRISSVKNTRKITKAMQMIAAVKMRKAVDAAIHTRTYAAMAKDLMENLKNTNLEHPLMKQRLKIDRVLVILITSNRGLCGGYNGTVLKTLHKKLGAIDKMKDDNKYAVDILALGKKASYFAKKNKLELIGIYEDFSDKPAFADILPISKTVIDLFLSKKYDRVSVIYTNYISGLSQKVEERVLLPVSITEVDALTNSIGPDEDISSKDQLDNMNITREYIFEPDKQALLEYVLPMMIEIQVYQSILESLASEHSSRMIAMKSATDSAGDMIDDLTLEFNKGRQAAITQEISEITAGANAS